MPDSLPRTRAALSALLAARGLRLRKRFGQSFLVEPTLADAIVAEAGVTERDAVVEIGPGAGGLTLPLLEVAARVTALELDRGLCSLLRDHLGGRRGFTLVEGDCLDGQGHASGLHPAIRDALADTDDVERVLVVANLPYSCGTPVLARLLTLETPPDGIVAMLQREVVDRLRARPGTKEFGPLAILAQATAELEVLRRVPASVFLPRPQIESVVFRVTPDRARRAALPPIERIHTLTAAGFGKRRKTLANALRGLVPEDRLRAAGIDPKRRAEALSTDEWIGLVRSLSDLPLVLPGEAQD